MQIKVQKRLNQYQFQKRTVKKGQFLNQTQTKDSINNIVKTIAQHSIKAQTNLLRMIILVHVIIMK